MDVTGKFESNRVMYSYPGPGDNSFPPNSAVLEVGFQNPINIDTVTNSSVKLYPVNANGTDGTQINFSALDASNDKRSVYGTLGSSLSAGQKYHLVVTTAITDENGNNLMAFDAWNPNATTAYDIYFTTNSNNDTTAPQVWGTSLDSYKNTNGQVINVPQFLPIRIQFSKKMNSSTITDSDISDASSTIQIRDSENNRLVGDVVYLPEEKAALVNLASAFTPGANYTLIVKTTVTDLLGNALAQEYSQAFSVTPMADTVKPFIAQAECEEFECRIFFSEPVKKSQAESLKNYVLESPSGVSVSLSNKKIQYESMGQMVVIKDLSLKSDAFFKITVSNIQDLANNDLATTEDDPLTDNSAQLKVGASGLDPNVQRSIDGTNNNFNEFEGYVWANYDFFEAKMDKSAFTAGSFGLVSDKFGASMTGGGFRAEPMNKSTSQSTMWFIDVPVDQVIAENSYLQLKFPEGTVVSTATKPNSCMTNPGNGCSPVNGDINGPGTGTLTFTIDNLNDASRTVLLKLTGGATQARDFLTLDLNAIKTPSTKKDFNTDGYTVELSVLDSARRKVAGPYTSSPFFITGGGTAKIEGTITATGVDNGQTFDLQLGSPWSGVLSNTVTFSGGTATYKFENLQPGDYDIFLPSIVSLDKSSVATDYRTPPPPHFNVSDGVTKTYNFSLNDLSGAQDVNGNTLQTLTVNVTGGTATKKGVVEANSWSGHYKKEFTFDGDGAASVTFRAQQGQYFVNVWDYMPAFTFGPPPTPSFIPPAPKSVNVNGSLDADESSADTLGFVVLTPNRYISVTVKDENNNGIPNVDIFCQEPESMFGGGNGGRTSTDGVAMIRLFEGDFKCEAFVPGMQPMPPQKVRVTSSHNSEGNAATVVFTLKTAGLYKISGTVTSGSETVAYSPVWCNRVDDSGNWTPDWSNTGTDGSGAWSVLVAAGTWRCQADIMGYGPTDATEKTVSTTDVTGVTLSPPNDVVLFTGTIQINGAAPTQGGGVYAQRENGEQKFTNSKLDDNGTFTLRVKESNTDTYTVGVFIPGVLDKVLETGVSAAANSDLGTVDLSSGVALSTVTINLKNASNAAFNSEKAFVEITGTSAKNFKEFSGSSTSLQVPNGSGYKVRVTTKESGPLAEQTDVTVSADVALNFALLSNPVTISGKVTDADSAANQQGAFVSVLNPITGFKAEVQTNSSGNYTIQTPPNATYNVSVRKTGYLPEPPISQVVTTSAVSNLNFAIDAEAQGISITGTVTLGSTTANNNATVSARCTNGASVMDAVDNLGAYEVKLHQSSTITCTLEAYADGYTTPTANKQTVTPSTSQSGKNITATSTGGTIKPTKSSTVNPEQSSKVSDTDAGVEFNIPSGAITSSLTSATISMKKTGNIPKQTGNASIAADGIEISITDANGKAELSQPLTIVYDYATDSITDVQAENMTMAYLNESTGEWVDLPTTLDTTANTFTFSTDHFTVFGPKTNNDSVAPAAPTGLTATATSGQVVLNWADNAEADIDNYNIYRSTSSGVAISDSNQINTSSVAVSNYTDTTVSNGLTYYYAVTAVDSSGNESVISSEVSAAPVATSTVNSSSNTSGGGSTGYPPVVSIHQVSNSGEPEAELEAEVDSSSEEAVVTSEDQDQQQPNAEVSGGQVSFDFTNTDYEGHWAETYIDNVISLGLAQGVALNTFAPERNITRAEYTKMIVKAAGYLVPNKATKKSYGDVDLAAWYAPYIEVAKAAGMVKGYEDGTFRPNDTINRAEALKLLMEGLLTDKRVALDPTQGLLVNFGLTENPFTDLDLDTWYAEYVLDAYARGLVSGYEDHAF
ncbi:MAG: fibronectin type III domain-containing protein, partial [Candidatus Peregrinibacteria bacterium GW2011_GWE2_39_6]